MAEPSFLARTYIVRMGCTDQAFEMATATWWTEAGTSLSHLRHLTEFLVSVSLRVVPAEAGSAWLHSALALYLQEGDSSMAVKIGRHLQHLWFREGRWFEVMGLARTLLALTISARDAMGVWTGLGSAYVAVTQYEEAEVAYRRAMETWNADTGCGALGWAYHGLSATLAYQQRWKEGVRAAERACDLYGRAEFSLLPAAQVNLGWCLGHEGGESGFKGLKWVEQALARYDQDSDRVAWASTFATYTERQAFLDARG